MEEINLEVQKMAEWIALEMGEDGSSPLGIAETLYGLGYRREELIKPSDSGGEKEVEELAEELELSFGPIITFGEPKDTSKYFTVFAKRLIKKGYSKHPKSNELFEINELKESYCEGYSDGRKSYQPKEPK